MAVVSTRQILLAATLAVCIAACASLWHVVPDHLSNLLLYLITGSALGSIAYQLRYGHLETEKMIESQLSRAAVLSLVLTVVLAAFSLLWEETQLRTVIVGLAGAIAMYLFLREKKPVDADTLKPIPGLVTTPELPPKTDPLKGHMCGVVDSDADAATAAFDWEELTSTLTTLGDRQRQKTLQILRRIFTAGTECGECPIDKDSRDVRLQQVIWTVEQEAQRLVQAAKMAEREQQDADMLSKASELVEWAVQKTPEITELDITDLLMAKAVADISHLCCDVSNIIVDLADLKALHNVNRDTAVEKSRTRALVARECLPLLQSNGLVISEALIAANQDLKAFESITGVQVVSLGKGDGYVTFEGNGRVWALKQAFGPEVGLKVEVRLFEFPGESTCSDIIRRVQRVRSWKKVTDEWPPAV